MKNFIQGLKKVLTSILSWASAFLLIAMTCLVLYQVFTRYVLNDPADFTEEIIRYLLIWTGFIGAAYTFSIRGHMSLILFKESLKPEKQRVLMAGIDILILLFALFVMVMGGFKLAASANREFSALLGIPRTLVLSMAPVSGILIILAQVINIWEDITGNAVLDTDNGEEN